MTNDSDNATVEEVQICNCTNEQLERGETCGLPICPNAGHPRLGADGEAISAVPTEEGRVDDRALDLLDAHADFDRNDFAWVGSEHLGGGNFCASVYTGTAIDSPYLWITKGENDPQGFLACVYVGGPDGEEPEDPFLVAECDDDLAAESLRMLASARGR